MKRIFFVFLAVALAACTNEPQYANRAEKILAEMHDPTSDYVIVASHRGDWRNYPENSIPAIESVIRMGVDIVEIDLKMTKDSVLVLSHDKTIDRMLNGKGLVSDFTLDSLRTFRLKRAHNVTTDSLRITTLEEALTVCKDRIVVNLDHAWDYYDAAIAVAEKVGVVDQILMKGKKPLKVVEDKLSTHENNFMYMPIINILTESGKKLYNDYHHRGFDIYQVSLDVDKVQWATTVMGQDLPWTNVCDTRGAASEYVTLYNLLYQTEDGNIGIAVPAAFVINDGELVDGEIVDEASFRKLLEKLL